MFKILIISVVIGPIWSQLQEDFLRDMDSRFCPKGICHLKTSEVVCEFECDSGYIMDVYPCLQILYKMGNCENKTVELTITSYVMYYNKIVFSRFLRDNLIQPEILMLDFDLVSHMTENAFNDGPFEKVHSLTISNLRIESLGPNSFVGLNSLQYLALQDIHLTSIPDCLHGVASSLNEIVIIAAITNRAMYRFNGLLSGVMLTALQHVELKLNLQNSVIGDPFKSTRLLTIDLSMCKIEFIHSDAFITIQDSVQQINLSGNELKTLPTGMFSYLLPRESLVIDLTNNPWDCECHLSELRKNLRMYEKNFSPNSVCDTPAEFNGLAIKNASFCGKQTGNVTEDDPTVNFMVVQCLSQQSGKWFSEMVVRHREIKFNVVHDLDTADVALHIYPNDDGEQKRMVAFSALQQTGIQVVNYHCKCENIPIALNQRLRKAVYYTLCVQDKSTRMTIAQNCMAFQLGNRHFNVWKTSNHRLLTIFVLIGIYLLMIFFGGIIMVILYGRFVSVPLRIAQNTCNSVGWDCRQDDRRPSLISCESESHYAELVFKNSSRKSSLTSCQPEYLTIKQ